MKKLILSFTLIIAAIFTASAQSSYIIPKAGFTISKLGGSDAKDENETKFNEGFVGGAAFEIGITEKFSIQPELLFIQKGAKDKNVDAKLILNYFEIPVLFKVYVGPVYFNVGPYVAFGSKVKSTSSSISVSQSFKDAGVNSTDAGIALGLGVAFKAGPGKIVIDARYDDGFSKLPKDAQTGDEIFNRSIAFSVGYAIPLESK